MTKPASIKCFKTSPEIIRLAVMLYIRFPLSLRNVEDLLHKRRIDISQETVRYWWNRIGPMFASEIRSKRVQQLRAFSKWKWHVDEVFVKVNGKRHYFWRAIDHEGEVLEAVVTKRRNKQAALKFLKKLMKRHGKAETVVTDRFALYRAALREFGVTEKIKDGPVAQQPRREFIPSFPTTRTRDATFQAHAKLAEVRRRPLLCLQPLQPGKIASQSRHLQADSRRRS